MNEFTPDFFALASLSFNSPNWVRSALDASQAQDDAILRRVQRLLQDVRLALAFSVNSSESNLGPTVMYL